MANPKSEPISIPGSTPGSNPTDSHLESWKSSLSQKITEKESQIKRIKEKLTGVEQLTRRQKHNLEILYEGINGTVVQVEKAIDSFIIDKTKKEVAQVEQPNSEIPSLSHLQFRGHHIFALFRDMYKQGSRFFSKREFSSEECELKQPPKEQEDEATSTKWLNYLFEDIRTEDTQWMDWLAPIWSLEDLYKNSLEEYKKAEGIYKIEMNRHQNLKDDFQKANSELDILYKEKEALSSFSDTLNGYRMSGSANSSPSTNSNDQFYDSTTMGAIEIQPNNDEVQTI
jgi:hypothetical protein